jgi:hypothetical protein
MTIAMDHPMFGPEPTPSKPATNTGPKGKERVLWSSPAQGLWVAETPSAYLGMVDLSHDGFVATSFAGRDLGVYATQPDAQRAVLRHWFLGAGQN